MPINKDGTHKVRERCHIEQQLPQANPLNQTTDSLNQTTLCSCGMFNRTGILCAHGLKILGLVNVKILPTHYVLKRWTKAAHNGSVQDKEGRNVVANPKLGSQLRLQGLVLQILQFDI
jgi:hypothetical protein